MPTKQKINGSKPWYFQTWNNESQDRKRYSPVSWPSNGSQQAPRTAWQLWPQRTHRQQAWPTTEGFAFCLRDMLNIRPYVFPPGFIAPIKVPDAVGVQTAGRQEVFLHATTNVTLCWLKHAQTQGSGLAKDILQCGQKLGRWWWHWCREIQPMLGPLCKGTSHFPAVPAVATLPIVPKTSA